MKSKIYTTKYITKSAEQTRKIGEKLAREIVSFSKEKSISPTTTLNSGERWGRGFSTQRNGAIVLAMQGDLGSSKTTFIQGFARGLGIKENITSPTFVILKKFEIAPQDCHSERSEESRGITAGTATARLTKGFFTEPVLSDSEVPAGSVQNDNGGKRLARQGNFYHIDCYRIEKPKDLLDLGVKNILSDRNNIVAIEWSEKIQKILPESAIQIKFEFVDENTRKITITSPLSF